MPGAPGGYVIVRKAVAAKTEPVAAGREAEEGQEVAQSAELRLEADSRQRKLKLEL